MNGTPERIASEPTPLNVGNPLVARDPELFAACAGHREHCISLLLRWEAARDLHEPDLLGPKPHYDFHEVKACVQVFDVLARPHWTQRDMEIFEGYSPYAMKGELFGDLAEEARHRIRSVAEEATEQLTHFSREQFPARQSNGKVSVR